VPVVVGHPGKQPVTRQAGVVDENIEIAGLGDESGGGRGVRDIRLNRPAVDLGGDLFCLVPAGVVPDRDRGARPRELDRNRTADAA
jgi:hypothetical protein